MSIYDTEICWLIPAEYKEAGDSISVKLGFSSGAATFVCPAYTVGVVDPTHYFFHTWSRSAKVDFLEQSIANESVPGITLTAEEQIALPNIIIYRGTVTQMLTAQNLNENQTI